MICQVYWSILFLLCLGKCQNDMDDLIPKNVDRKNSLAPPYQDSWKISGSTFVKQNYIRLTPDKPSKRGTIWNMNKINYPNWAVLINFRVHGEGSIFGDGFAFWYTKDMDIKGNAFGNQEKFIGLAVFFDTYANHNDHHSHAHPYISAMVNDGSHQYDHDQDGTLTQIGKGCSMLFRNSEDRSTVLIKYQDDMLTIRTQLVPNGEWKECFTTQVQLPTGYHFGLSSVTGDLSDNHDIYFMRVYQLDDGIHIGQDRMSLKPFSKSSAAERGSTIKL
ncbi:Lectin mannose-binding 2 [Intoshia linei]|uniref:Lectin mannose-binding 2 n=1 Tax=Intoshia linei TaxID=1819745 RepID=A0A177B3K1_9BILA|nr:Lectin mannose-binding 2 [Intoshia linei]